MRRPCVRAMAAAGLSCAAIAVLQPERALAAGFALKEQSATAQGASFAGATAGGDNISYMFFNPATITMHEGMQFHATTSLIIPVTEPEVRSSTTILGAPISGGDGGDDIGDDAVVPAVYGSFQVLDDLWFGISANVPFGLSTSYDANWAGRFHGVDSEVATINVNPVIAWKAPKWFSFAAGVQLQYIDARLTNALDVPPPMGVPDGVTDGFSELKGDDFGVGFNLGILFEPWEGTRLGFSYRSAIDHTLEGDIEITGLGPPLVNQDISADLTTPDNFSLGLYQRLAEDWALLADLTWTNWAHFDEIRVKFPDTPLPDSVTVEDWHDSWFAALGLEHRVDEALTLRGGVAFDQTPIPSDTRTPRLAGADRYWASLGGSYVVSDWLSLDASVTGILLDDPDVNLSATADPNNAARGNLSVDYDAWVGIVSVSGTIRF